MMNKRTIYTTTDGKEIHIRPVSHVLLERIAIVVEKEFRDKKEPIDPPQYTAVLAGGAEEHHDHDEESIRDAPQDEQDAWDEHLKANERLAAESSRRRGLFIFREGIDMQKTGADYAGGDWAERQARWGFDVPEDDDDRFMYYIETELLKTPSDQLGVISHIMALTMDGVPEDLVGAAQQFFRDQMGWYEATKSVPAPVDEAENRVLD